MDGFGAQEDEGEYGPGTGSVIADTAAGYSGGIMGAASQRVTSPLATPSPTPLNAILSRLEAAINRLTGINERLAGASGRLGTSEPANGPMSTDRSSNPGFVGAANDRIDDIFNAIDATSALAVAFCEAV